MVGISPIKMNGQLITWGWWKFMNIRKAHDMAVAYFCWVNPYFLGFKIHGPWLSMRFATEDILKLTTGGSGFSAHNDVEAKAKCRG